MSSVSDSNRAFAEKRSSLSTPEGKRSSLNIGSYDVVGSKHPSKKLSQASKTPVWLFAVLGLGVCIFSGFVYDLVSQGSSGNGTVPGKKKSKSSAEEKKKALAEKIEREEKKRAEKRACDEDLDCLKGYTPELPGETDVSDMYPGIEDKMTGKVDTEVHDPFEAVAYHRRSRDNSIRKLIMHMMEDLLVIAATGEKLNSDSLAELQTLLLDTKAFGKRAEEFVLWASGTGKQTEALMAQMQNALSVLRGVIRVKVQKESLLPETELSGLMKEFLTDTFTFDQPAYWEQLYQQTNGNVYEWYFAPDEELFPYATTPVLKGTDAAEKEEIDSIADGDEDTDFVSLPVSWPFYYQKEDDMNDDTFPVDKDGNRLSMKEVGEIDDNRKEKLFAKMPSTSEKKNTDGAEAASTIVAAQASKSETTAFLTNNSGELPKPLKTMQDFFGPDGPILRHYSTATPTPSDGNKPEQDEQTKSAVDEVNKKLNTNVKILMLGSGNSKLPEAVRAKFGYDVTATDISDTMVKLMQERNPEVKYQVLDATKPLELGLDDFDIVFEKGVLDNFAQKSEMYYQVLASMRNVLEPAGSDFKYNYDTTEQKFQTVGSAASSMPASKKRFWVSVTLHEAMKEHGADLINENTCKQVRLLKLPTVEKSSVTSDIVNLHWCEF
ncbi:unnamed protein product [Amoebophrya sp. A120]|nr:unnamed protein product [Amoebophrya sp. A120]|eukprot:GSA120T00020154001.1